jgi:putative membrane protein
MKKIFYWLLPAALFTAASCNSNSSSSTSTTDSTSTTKIITKDSVSSTADTTNSQADSGFAVDAAGGNMLEAKLGQLAATNASSDEVKKLGQMMYDDHTKANDQLTALAKKDNITIPTALNEKSQKTYDDLSKKTGKDFDKAFTDIMVSDHKKVIDAFQKEATSGSNPDLKTWANGKIPTLQGHLQMSEDAMADLKK